MSCIPAHSRNAASAAKRAGNVETMRAVTFSEFGGPEVMQLSELPDPVAGAGEVLLRVEAATINPVDASVVGGMAASRMPGKPPYIAGWDLAGHVEAVGEGADEALVGKYVLGFSQWFQGGVGTQAELVVLPLENIAVAPDTIPAVALTTFGLNGLTAYQLVERANLAEGTTVLVTGAAGGVGGFAVELAALKGARVFAAASEDEEDVVLGFGAEARVARDANPGAVRELVPDGVDVVLDTASVHASIGAVKDGGMWLTVVQPAEAERDIEVKRVGVKPNAEQLEKIVQLVADGKLSVRVESTYDVAHAVDAYTEFAKRHHGRVVLTF